MDRKEIAKILGKNGGEKSARTRFAGKSKEEISNMMRKVRCGKKTNNTKVK